MLFLIVLHDRFGRTYFFKRSPIFKEQPIIWVDYQCKLTKIKCDCPAFPPQPHGDGEGLFLLQRQVQDLRLWARLFLVFVPGIFLCGHHKELRMVLLQKIVTEQCPR